MDPWGGKWSVLKIMHLEWGKLWWAVKGDRREADSKSAEETIRNQVQKLKYNIKNAVKKDLVNGNELSLVQEHGRAWSP